MGHIQWSPLAVDQAMNQAEKDIEPIFEHLDRAYETVSKALTQPNLPQYMKQSLQGVQYAVGSIRHHQDGAYPHRGQLLNAIDRVRNDLPQQNLKEEKESARHGTRLTLGV